LPLTCHFSIDTHPFAGPRRALVRAQRARRMVPTVSSTRESTAMLRRVARWPRRPIGPIIGAAMYCLSLAALGQYPQERPAMLPASTPLGPPGTTPQIGPGQLVVDVVIEGEYTSKDYEIQKHIHTRKDREFDADVLQGDVRRLVTSGLFRDVKTYTEQAPGGVIVRFKVFERPRIKEIKFLGNRGFSDKKLKKEIGVKEGDPLNAYAAEESRRKIEELYHTSGFPKATAAIFEGDKPGDRGLVFLINEGQLERISSVTFAGNTIASDPQLRTKIQSKPGWFWYLFGGKVDRTKIDADAQTITAYYRSLGYFRARVSRSLDYDDNGKWLKLTFIIDEGPRYKVRNVSIEGVTKFSPEPLAKFMELKSGEYFNQSESNKDLNTLTDLYGSQGHVFADVQADLRFLEEPGTLDVAYRIKEGEVFRVGEINVKIAGEFPHTKQTVVLNRVSLRPGDIIDTREVRNSERRLKASQLFAGNPGQNDGEPPRIVVRPPDLNSLSGIAAAPPPQETVRGQEPEPQRVNLRSRWSPPPTPSDIPSWDGRQSAASNTYPSPPPSPYLR
jgi:outer membrane protein insertion porin family